MSFWSAAAAAAADDDTEAVLEVHLGAGRVAAEVASL